MKKWGFFTLTIIISVTMVFSVSSKSFATENTTTSSTESDDEKTAEARAKAEAALEEAKEQKEELDSALADAEALVKGLKASKSTAQEKVDSLNSQLKSISAQISDVEDQLSQLEIDIEEANTELSAAQELADEQYASMKLRIQYIYENGNTNYLIKILSARDLSSLINSIEYVSQLSEYDRTMLDDYEASIAYIENKKAELDSQYETAQTLRDEIGVQQQTVQVLKDAKTEELNSIGEDLEDAEDVAKAYAEEVKAQEEILAAIQSTINAIDYGDSYISSSGFVWPCPSYTRVSSDYGPRTAPTTGASTYHKGLDLAAPYGSAILAAESGVVTKATYSSSAGNYIIINHGTDSSGNVICTVYMHCSSIAVSEGDTVYRGQTIAAVGSTGVSTGNHLHFGVTSNGSYVSPWNYVSKP